MKKQATLVAGEAGPVKGATIVVFESIAAPEAVLCVHRSGGILVSGDSLQNFTGADEFFDTVTGETLEKGGFFKRGNIGSAWRARLQPEKKDFERILGLEFKHLLPAHGVKFRQNGTAHLRGRYRGATLGAQQVGGSQAVGQHRPDRRLNPVGLAAGVE